MGKWGGGLIRQFLIGTVIVISSDPQCKKIAMPELMDHVRIRQKCLQSGKLLISYFVFRTKVTFAFLL